MLLMFVAGCVQYHDFDTGSAFASSSSDDCEIIIESEGDIKEDGATAAVDFYARVGGEDCNPGGVHEVEMDEWDDGGGMTNPSEDSTDVVRTGEIKRYTLACRIDDDTQPGECGCTLRLPGGDETTVSLVID